VQPWAAKAARFARAEYYGFGFAQWRLPFRDTNMIAPLALDFKALPRFCCGAR
jgi:hypothetical protein